MYEEQLRDYVLERMEFIGANGDDSYWGNCRKPSYEADLCNMLDGEEILGHIVCIAYMLVADNELYMPIRLKFGYTNQYGAKIYFSIIKDKHSDSVKMQIDKIVSFIN